MSPLLLAVAEEREASPIALVVILCLIVAVVLLVRSMNKHLRRLPARFEGEPGEPGGPGAAPAERRTDPPDRPTGS